MKNTNMIRFTRGAVLAGLVLGSSMAHAWRAPIQVKVQPSWLSQNKGTIALTTGVVGLAAFLGTTIYKYKYSTDTKREGFGGYFGFVWDGTKAYFTAAKTGVNNAYHYVRPNLDDRKAHRDDLNKQIGKVDEQIKAEKAKKDNEAVVKSLEAKKAKLEGKRDKTVETITALEKAEAAAKVEADAKAEAKAKADKEAAAAVAKTAPAAGAPKA